MKKICTLAGAVAAATFLSVSHGRADVTPQQVWSDWTSYLEGFGYDVKADVGESGDTLTVRDMVLTMQLPENEGTMTMTMGGFGLRDLGDGTVAIEVPASLPISIAARPTGEDAVDATVVSTHSALSMVVSGDPDDLTYTYTADEVGLVLDRLSVNAQPVVVDMAQMAMRGLSGSTRMTLGDLRETAQKLAAQQITYGVDFTAPEDDDPDNDGTVKMQGMVTGFSAEGTTRMPRAAQAATEAGAMPDLLAAGAAFDGTMSYNEGQSSLGFTGDGDTGSMLSSSAGGSLSVAVNRDRFSYSGNVNAVNAAIESSDLPFPIEVKMDSAGFNVMAPLSKSDAPRDFAFGLTLGGFSTTDAIWGMFDPQGKLPRDPATIMLDLTGKVKLLVDLTDPEQMQSLETGETVPGELHEVTLNDITVEAVGARLNGSGAFTFDNGDMTTFNGMPAPDGQVDLTLTGVNALLDNLVAMGLLPQEQAMGARMMMGLFAVPGEGEDSLRSTIEVKPNGQVLANGQRIK